MTHAKLALANLVIDPNIVATGRQVDPDLNFASMPSLEVQVIH
jgi:hypothetical protein